MELEQSAEEIEQAIWTLSEQKKALIKGPVTQRDKKLKEMRNEFTKLEHFEKWIVDYKKQMGKQLDFLDKECINIETRLFTTKQLVAREIES